MSIEIQLSKRGWFFIYILKLSLLDSILSKNFIVLSRRNSLSFLEWLCVNCKENNILPLKLFFGLLYSLKLVEPITKECFLKYLPPFSVLKEEILNFFNFFIERLIDFIESFRTLTRISW